MHSSNLHRARWKQSITIFRDNAAAPWLERRESRYCQSVTNGMQTA
jgi:hypothetical protein